MHHSSRKSEDLLQPERETSIVNRKIRQLGVLCQAKSSCYNSTEELQFSIKNNKDIISSSLLCFPPTQGVFISFQCLNLIKKKVYDLLGS